MTAISTRLKLAEADFFLGELENHYYDELQKGVGDPTAGFYLSAFVSAARAVSWIMKSEYGRVPGWEEWWHSQKPDEAEAGLLASFTKLRNKSQKAMPVVLDRKIQIGEGDHNESGELDVKMPRVGITFTPVEKSGAPLSRSNIGRRSPLTILMCLIFIKWTPLGWRCSPSTIKG